MRPETLGDRPGAGLRGGLGSLVDGSAPAVRSGRKWKGAQSGQGATELGFPGPALGKMQSKAAGRTGEPSGHREEASSEGLGGHHLLTQTDAHCPASEVVGVKGGEKMYRVGGSTFIASRRPGPSTHSPRLITASPNAFGFRNIRLMVSHLYSQTTPFLATRP